MLLKSIAKRVKSTKEIPLQEFIDTVEMLGFTTESSAKFESPDWLREDQRLDRSKYPEEISGSERKSLQSKYPRIENPEIGYVCVSGFEKYVDTERDRHFPKYMVAVESILVRKGADKTEIIVKRFWKSKNKYVDLSSTTLNFLYGHGADKKAEEIVGEREKEKEKPDETISPDTCGACGRRIHSTKNNKIMRHGWRGSIRHGQQVLYQGECVGWDTTPVEDSKEGIAKQRDRIIKMINGCESYIAHLKTGNAIFSPPYGKNNMTKIDNTHPRHKIMTEQALRSEELKLNYLKMDLQEIEKKLSSWKRDFSRGLLKSILIGA